MHQGYHHLHTRKIGPYPHPIFWKRCLDWLMYCVGIITPVVLIPQLLSVWVTRDVSGVSVITWLSFSIINALWVIYGVAHKARAVIVSSLLMCILNFLVAIGALIFR